MDRNLIVLLLLPIVGIIFFKVLNKLCPDCDHDWQVIDIKDYSELRKYYKLNYRTLEDEVKIYCPKCGEIEKMNSVKWSEIQRIKKIDEDYRASSIK